jgi:regulator of sigma E protease
VAGRVHSRVLKLEVVDKDGNPRTRKLDLSKINTQIDQRRMLRDIGIGFVPPPLPVIGAFTDKKLPAKQAGLQVGDRILSINGKRVKDFNELAKEINKNANKLVTLKIQRKGKPTFDVKLTPVEHKHNGKVVGVIGFYPQRAPEKTVVEQYGPIDAFGVGLVKTYESSFLLVRFVKLLITTEAASSNIGGPVMIGRITGGVLQTKHLSARQKFEQFLQILAALSVTLGVLNLLPIPMLDGGHFVYYVYEAIFKKPVSEEFVKYATVFGLILLLSLMLFALYNDLGSILGFQTK